MMKRLILSASVVLMGLTAIAPSASAQRAGQGINPELEQGADPGLAQRSEPGFDQRPEQRSEQMQMMRFGPQASTPGQVSQGSTLQDLILFNRDVRDKK